MKPYFVLLCALVLCQCGPVEVEGSFPDGSKKLCINSYFLTDSTWVINVAKGIHIPDRDPYFEVDGFNRNLAITNATVNISKGGAPYSVLHPLTLRDRNPSIGWYQSLEETAEGGYTYEVHVSAPGFTDASARCFVPEPVSLSSAEPLSPTPDETFRLPFVITFTDRSTTTDYYEIVMQIAIKKVILPDGYELDEQFTVEVPVYTQDPLFYYTPDSYDPLDASGSTRAILFSDKGMNGASLKITGEAQVNTIPDAKIEADYYMILRTLSEDYYKYKTTRQFQQTSQNDPFAQPIQVYSNVENGFGIFAGASQQRLQVYGIE